MQPKANVEMSFLSPGFEVVASGRAVGVEVCSLQTVRILAVVSHLVTAFHYVQEYHLEHFHPLQAQQIDLQQQMEAGPEQAVQSESMLRLASANLFVPLRAFGYQLPGFGIPSLHP